MVRYWLRRPSRARWRRGLVNGAGRGRPASSRHRRLVEVHAGRVGGDVAIPLLVLGFYGIRRHYSEVARRLRAGFRRSRRRRRRRIASCSTSVVRRDREAVWYARQIAGRRLTGDPRPGRTAAGIPRGGLTARTGRRRRAGERKAVEPSSSTSWASPQRVRVRHRDRPRALRRSLDAGPASVEFSVKLRLLREPGVVVTNVPLVAGRTPA